MLKQYTQQDGDMFLATGVDRQGKRFRIMNSNWNYIRCINIWRGSRWLYRKGERFLIQRIYN